MDKYYYAEILNKKFHGKPSFNMPEEDSEEYLDDDYNYDELDLDLCILQLKENAGFFPYIYEEFCQDKEIFQIIDTYNARIAYLNHKGNTLDIEALFYAVMYIYYIIECYCINQITGLKTIREQLQMLYNALDGIHGFILTPKVLEERMSENGKVHSYIAKEPIDCIGDTLIKNLRNSVSNLLKQDKIISDCQRVKPKYADLNLGLSLTPQTIPDDLYETVEDYISVDIVEGCLSAFERVSYSPTKKAWLAMKMLKYLFEQLHLPNIRARKQLDVSEFDGKDERSYSINRLIAILLNILHYTDSRREGIIKGLMSKYKNLQPNTLTGF